MAAFVIFFGSCEKELDNSIPVDQVNRKQYNQQFADLLPLSDNSQVWLSNSVDLGNNSKSFLRFKFDANKQAEIAVYDYDYPTVIDQLANLYYNDPTLSNDEAGLIVFLVNTFDGLPDASLRDALLNNPANIDYLEATDYFVPLAYTIGSPILLQDESPYSIDGYFDTNLTFGSQSILSELKNFRIFDFDFQVTSFNKDSIELYGAYYNKNQNRNVTLKPYQTTALPIFERAAAIVSELQREGIATILKVDGTAVAGLQDKSGAGYLFRNYETGVKMAVPQVGFQSRQLADWILPELADIDFLEAKLAYDGELADAPAGTVLVSFDVYGPFGTMPDGRKLELVVAP